MIRNFWIEERKRRMIEWFADEVCVLFQISLQEFMEMPIDEQFEMVETLERLSE